MSRKKEDHSLPPTADSLLPSSTLRIVAWRIIPFVCLLYVLNILDRANVGFARLAMQDDLGLSKAAFDLGYGMFYLGYLLFEVPSVLIQSEVDSTDGKAGAQMRKEKTMMKMFDLTDRVAVVSGAAQGLGRATALALAQHGAHTVLVDRNQAGAEATAARIQSLGPETLVADSDVSDPDSVDELFRMVDAKFSRVDFLGNIAGDGISQNQKI